MHYVYPPLAFLQNIGTTEWIVIGVLGVLLFGNRLPEVGRNLARSIGEFKKEWKGISNEVNNVTDAPKNIVKDISQTTKEVTTSVNTSSEKSEE